MVLVPDLMLNSMANSTADQLDQSEGEHECSVMIAVQRSNVLLLPVEELADLTHTMSCASDGGEISAHE